MEAVALYVVNIPCSDGSVLPRPIEGNWALLPVTRFLFLKPSFCDFSARGGDRVSDWRHPVGRLEHCRNRLSLPGKSRCWFESHCSLQTEAALSRTNAKFGTPPAADTISPTNPAVSTLIAVITMMNRRRI